MDKRISDLPDEGTVVRRARTEPAAFATLYDHYAPRIYTYMRYRVDDVPTAEDLTAEAFEQALIKLPNYRPERAPFSAWLFGIAHHVVSHHYRAQNGHRWLPLDAAADHASDTMPPEYAAIQEEAQHRLMAAVAGLDNRERDLLALKFAGGLNNRQIAEITGLSESNVGVILHRSIKQLRDMLKEEEIEHE